MLTTIIRQQSEEEKEEKEENEKERPVSMKLRITNGLVLCLRPLRVLPRVECFIGIRILTVFKGNYLYVFVLFFRESFECRFL